MQNRRFSCAIFFLSVLMQGCFSLLKAQVYEKVYSFTDARAADIASQPTGFSPSAPLVQGSDGNFYGTTEGTSFDSMGTYGTVFKMTPGGVRTTLVEFTGNGANNKGTYPQAGLVQGSDGNFYGTTSTGGASGYGTVFKVTSGGVLTTLVEFTGNGGDNKGGSPVASLVQGGDGNFYGTTEGGGASNDGTVFKMTPGGVLTTLVEFTYSGSTAALVKGADGNFYGTTGRGGAGNYGTVFKMTPGGVLTTLVEFTSNGVSNKGSFPHGALVLGGDGNFYGTTAQGGGVNDSGTVFKMTPGGALTTLVQFTDNGANNKGSHPRAGLIQGGDGNFYGTTQYGGATGWGTVFKMTPGGVLTTLAEFTDNEPSNQGSVPCASLVQGSDGNFYGTTHNGGANDGGTVFKMNPGGALTTLVQFSVRRVSHIGSSPQAGLVQGSDGNLYGTSYEGGAGNYGTVFKMTSGAVLTTLVEFTGNGASNKGSWPRAGLMQGSDGNFYGTTERGGTIDNGTVFKMTPGGVLTTLVEFTGNGPSNKGKYPQAGLVEVGGNFYGTTYQGGANDKGTVFRMTPGGLLTTLVQFTGDGAINRGAYPQAGLTQGGDGNFYGTTYSSDRYYSPDHDPWDGELFSGTVFKMTPDGGLTTLLQFYNSSLPVNVGIYPKAGLVRGFDGNLYGTTTSLGYTGNAGTVFRISTNGTAGGTVLTTLVNFTGDGASNKGSSPQAGLVQGSGGNFYGTTARGGANDAGTVFKMTSGGVLTTLLDCVSPDDYPNAPMVKAADGTFYGTMSGLRSGSDGSIYRLIFPGLPLLFHREPQIQDKFSAIVQTSVNAAGSTASISLEYGVVGNLPPNSFTSVPVATNVSGDLTKIVGTTLAGLSPGTTYYYRFRAANSMGTALSPVKSFSTLADPVVATDTATDILSTSARINGTVNPRNYATTAYFEWGTNANSFPNSTPPVVIAGNLDKPMSADIAGLTPGAVYYYRVVATNAADTVVSGAGSFTALIKSQAQLGVAEALSTTRARVTGTVDTLGSSAAVSFEWGVDGEEGNGDSDADYPHSALAVPGTVSGSGAKDVVAVMTGLTQGKTYHYRIRAEGPGGTGLSAKGTISLSILSGLVQKFPDPPAASNGKVTVNFTPASRGGWRFEGETAWRKSGVAADHIAGGKRLVEFLPVTGYISPPQEMLDVASTGSLTLARIYYQTPTAGDGGLTVRLKPADVGGKWRIVGETVWLSSGASLTGRAAGSYLVECREAGDAWDTPPVVSVTVEKGKTRELTLTYYISNDAGASVPKPVSFNSVSTDEDLPFAYVGQIRSQVGSSTGFVVKRRVVATAGHVVFDDGTFSALTNLQWLLQRHAGKNEPQPQVPRGYYMAKGYADQRREEETPGEASYESQHLDYAALYFSEEGGRGGYGGYLASDSGDDNEFLDSSSEKILAGYAMDGIATADQGKLHATAPFNNPLSPAFGETWTTTAVRGQGGCSGGPLFVRHTNGSYYPAAIYLGGGGQTVVRGIDGKVVELFLFAEISGNGGEEHTGGGVTHASVSGTVDVDEPGTLVVKIVPAGAAALARWGLKPELPIRRSEDRRGELTAGPYQLVASKGVPGYKDPVEETETVDIPGGQITTITFKYVAEPPSENAEISVEEPVGTSLKDGKSTSAFGNVVVKSPVVKTYTIRNLGKKALMGLAVSRDGANAGDFTVTKPLKTSLALGKTTTFQVTFKPSVAGSREAALRIKSNDADESPFDITLTGKGVTAKKSPLLAADSRLSSWADLAGGGRIRPKAPGLPLASVVTLPDGSRYRALTVETFPGAVHPRDAVEVSPDLIDWQSGPRYTTILEEAPFFLKVRDNTPFTTKSKRFIRLKPKPE